MVDRVDVYFKIFHELRTVRTRSNSDTHSLDILYGVGGEEESIDVILLTIKRNTGIRSKPAIGIKYLKLILKEM